MAEWWDKETALPLKDLNFQKIISFYLFSCPCETEKGSEKKGTKCYSKVSKRATTLRMQGWTGRYLNTLLASMKHTTSGHLEYHTFSADADIRVEVNRLEKNSSLTDVNFEMIAITQRADMSKTSSIFYYIRNALAHGSFSVIKDNGNIIYYLESNKDDKAKARIRLREETLLKWVEDFALSPKVLKEALALDRNRNKRKKKGSKAA